MFYKSNKWQIDISGKVIHLKFEDLDKCSVGAKQNWFPRSWERWQNWTDEEEKLDLPSL